MQDSLANAASLSKMGVASTRVLTLDLFQKGKKMAWHGKQIGRETLIDGNKRTGSPCVCVPPVSVQKPDVKLLCTFCIPCSTNDRIGLQKGIRLTKSLQIHGLWFH